MSELSKSVLAAVRNGIGHLTLNRPAGLNSLTLDMVRTLRLHLDEWAEDSDVRAVVLRSCSEKAFCAGGDIRSLYESFKAGANHHITFFQEEYALDQYIHEYPKPVMALMDGFVLGGGMGLVQGASLRVVTERVKMGMPEVGIGYFPDVGASFFLSRLPGAAGAYLGLTGNQISAADALYIGLADWCIKSSQFEKLDRYLDSMTWTRNPKEDLRGLLSKLATNQLSGSELESMRPVIDAHFAQPNISGILNALAEEERPAYKDWAKRNLQILNSRSPIAVCVTLELLRRGRALSLGDCLALELHIDRQWFAKGDIMEGVRALIIDKDKSPRWAPQTFHEVTTSAVQDFFKNFRPEK
ncbi:enoyl-CoA hydratase/isomerase family protein [Stutzerimonas kunmingensis]|uniref:enoyl-CoA hydratase/isomerase family protein n=1 Tax=Stutzerimonas kunmingensis TaxID=1211807 RepID=UPI0028A9C8B7|nr:enoyl-CoA hydratase/isomerase family protein [Stutzerimonas kunmingensis]